MPLYFQSSFEDVVFKFIRFLIWPTDTLVPLVYSRMIWLFAVMRSTKVCIRCESSAALIQPDSSRFVIITRLRASLRKDMAR